MRVAPAVTIDKSQRETLQQWVRSRSLRARQIERARVALLAADSVSAMAAARNRVYLIFDRSVQSPGRLGRCGTGRSVYLA
jgi:hypothetical protein